jgi:hypothetical protein
MSWGACAKSTGWTRCAEDVDGDDVQRDRRLLKRAALQMRCDQPAQATVADQVLLRPEQAQQSRSGLSAKVWALRTSLQTAASASAVATVWGRQAMNALLIAG